LASNPRSRRGGSASSGSPRWNRAAAPLGDCSGWWIGFTTTHLRNPRRIARTQHYPATWRRINSTRCWPSFPHDNAEVLALMRRAAVSIACAWMTRETNARRANLPGFFEAMRPNAVELATQSPTQNAASLTALVE